MSTPAWSDADLANNPHAAADKARRVRQMFSAIAPSYDLNNRLHSLWRDQAWRRAAVKQAMVKPGDVVLDVACGTGDLSMAFATAGAARVIGVDFTYEMLTVAMGKGQGPRAKGRGEEGTGDRQQGSEAGVQASALQGRQVDGLRLAETPKASGEPGTATSNGSANPNPQSEIPNPKSLGPRPLALCPSPSYHTGDAMRLPVADASVDVVSIAFGIRNVSDPAKALREFFRALRPGGRAVVLEFSLPRNAVLRGLYNFYFRHIMPRTAALIARDRSGAYKYLPKSVNTFINRETMVDMMRQAGFTDVTVKPLTFGIAVIYRGVKP